MAISSHQHPQSKGGETRRGLSMVVVGGVNAGGDEFANVMLIRVSIGGARLL
ncbi:hypothetical protein Hanom_Chr03g00234281 [Helianthus anomalus]